MKQADIDAIRTAMDPDLPDKLKNNYLATIQELQESLVGKAIEAHNKAVQSGSYADKYDAQALFADLEKAVDPAVVTWAKNAKNQTDIIQQVVTIKDKNLEKAIRNALNKPTGDLYKSELQSMTSLNGTGMSITDLSSLKYLTNLTDLRLDNNKISDISILKELKNLKYLSLSNNNISDITPLQGLTNLNKLFLNFNKITDISAVKNLTNLTWFYVEGNQIKNISGLHGLTKLTNLNLYNNEIRNLDIIALKKALPKCSFYNQ
ncbi:leucine-rich repeat domain-containing protein [Clostridium thermarum]|uniref:leucine-rich repeat domain-containing protein n=1 Tax=Clostridium thermarum TaxID=1716543 RepID=UPI00311A9942